MCEQGLKQVLQLDRVLKIVSCSEEELLAVISNFAVLVQGCWVSGSHVRPEYGGDLRPIRDYILLLFSKNRVVTHEQLRGLSLAKEALRHIMVPIAVQRANVGWEFQVRTQMNIHVLKQMFFFFTIVLNSLQFQNSKHPMKFSYDTCQEHYTSVNICFLLELFLYGAGE